MTTAVSDSKRDLPAYAMDTEKNIARVLTPEGSPGLSQEQIDGIALTAAYATRIGCAARWAEARAERTLDSAQIEAARTAASSMAMNNVYYRFTEYSGDPEISALPPRLRMTVIENPGVRQADFELNLLAASAINGCKFCVSRHVKKLLAGGLSREAVQSCGRIAAAVSAVAQTKLIENLRT